MWRHLLTVMRVVSIAAPSVTLPQSPLRDADDAPIWTTAVVSGAQYVISHNTRDFPPLVRSVETIGGQQRTIQRHIYQGTEFLTAIEFIQDVLGSRQRRSLIVQCQRVASSAASAASPLCNHFAHPVELSLPTRITPSRRETSRTETF